MNAKTENFTLPHSRESEQSILGALLIDNGAIDRIGELSEAAFFSEAHRLIFRAIRKQAEAGKTWDSITVAEMLEVNKKLEQAGGLAYIGDVASNCYSSANISLHAKTVREHFTRRQIMSVANELNELVSAKGDISLAMDRTQAALLEITEGVRTDDPRSIRDVIDEHFNVLEKRLQNDRKGIPTGLTDLDSILNGGWQRGQSIVIAGRPGHGKELTLSSKVLLSSGAFKRMGDIVINDKVASIDGRKSFVTGVFPNGVKPIYKITFSDGRSVDAGLEHQWEINFRQWDKPRIYTTADLIEKLKCQRYQKRLSIPYPSGVFGIDENLLIHPYLLGVLLGDGGLTSSTVKLTTSYDHILNKIKPMLDGAELKKENGESITYRISTPGKSENKIHDAIKKFGLAGKLSTDKFIPEQYLRASKKSRIELLQGLMDTDGTVGKDGSMVYSTSSHQMALEIQSLVRSLGAYCSMNSRIPKFSYKGEKKEGKRNYCLFISHPDYADFVTIPHKKDRTKTKSGRRLLNIESIEYIGEEECQCISVSHERELYLTNDYIVTHNSALSLHNALVAAEASYGVLYLSMEMVASELADRALAQIGRIYLGNMLTGKLNEREWEGVTAATGKIQDMPLHILDRSGLSFFQVATFARRHKRKHGLDLLVLDYLQLMAGDEGDKRHSQIEEITRNLKALAKELNVAIIVLSQLARKTENARRPKLSDLRDSSSVEQDADVVIFIHREEMDNPETTWKGYADIHVAKNRQGAIGRIGATYIGSQVRFENFSGALPDWDVKSNKHQEGYK